MRDERIIENLQGIIKSIDLIQTRFSKISKPASAEKHQHHHNSLQPQLLEIIFHLILVHGE